MLETIVSSLDWTQIVIFLLASVGSAVFVWYRKKLREWSRSIAQIADSLRKIPELETKIAAIHYHVSPNGGGSIIDTVKRVEKAVCKLGNDLTLLSDTMRVQNDTDENVGRFYTSNEGDNTYVNQVYARMLRVGKAELLGWSFLNFIHPEDVNRVKSHWEQCREERRQYKNRHRMVTSEGEVVEVEVIASPVPDSGEPRIWVGTVRKIEAKR